MVAGRLRRIYLAADALRLGPCRRHGVVELFFLRASHLKKKISRRRFASRTGRVIQAQEQRRVSRFAVYKWDYTTVFAASWFHLDLRIGPISRDTALLARS